jgi:signal peptidase I
MNRAQAAPRHSASERPPTRPDPDGVRTLTVPSETMGPTIPMGAEVVADFDVFDAERPSLGDIVIFRPPRSAVHMRSDGTYRCGAPTRHRQMCRQPVPRLSSAWFIKRVVGLPGDRLRLRHGRLIRNGHRVDEPFIDRSRCPEHISECQFPRRMTVPRNHYFLLGDNRGFSDDSRYWGPVPRRAFLARVGTCTTATGKRCGDSP